MIRAANFYHNLSIFHKILIWMLIVSVLPLTAMGLMNFSRSLSMEAARCKTEISNSLQEIAKDVAAQVDDLRLQGIRVTLDEELVSVLTRPGTPDTSSRYQLEKTLFDISLSGRCHSASVFGANGLYASNSSSSELQRILSEQAQSYRTQLERSGSLFLWGAPIALGPKQLLPYLRLINEPNGGNPIGLFVANLPESTLSHLSKGLMQKSNVRAENVLIVSGGVVLSSWDPALIGQTLSAVVPTAQQRQPVFDADYGGQACLFVQYENAKASDWRYIAVVSHREIRAASMNIIELSVVVIAMCVLFILMASFFVSRSISRPLGYLSGAMLEIGNRNLDVALKRPQYHDEVGRMWNSLIDMTQMLRRSMAESQLAMEQNQRLRYEALQAQINPHFLYNTFASVTFLIEDGKQKEATQMLTALAELLHTSISRSMEYITVEQEVELVRHYMDIQKVRYHNSFRYMLDVDLEILKLRTVKIILQPMIENALEHGIKKLSGTDGLISLRGWQEQDLLLFEIYDNAGALTDARMEEVNAMLQSPKLAPTARVGIGLKNVNDRIRYEFPGDERLGVFLCRRGRGTCARIVTKQAEAE